MAKGIKLGNITVDCADAKGLCDFYARFLGWEKIEMFGMPAVKDPGGMTILFVADEDYVYVPPVWPEQEGKQQKQIHFDFFVPDIAAAVKEAESLGAVKTKDQFGGDHFTTMLDPAGHPICICGA
jgi:catechol 2,3-dioxygenase-like lactoylglutathione lyase family enzyme